MFFLFELIYGQQFDQLFMRLLLRNYRGIANRFDSRKPQAPKEPGIIAKVTGAMETAQFNEFMQELDEYEPGAFSQFMFDNVGLPDTVHTQEFTKESEQDEMGEEEIQQLGLELQWETVAPHLFYPRFNIMRKRPNEEIIQEKLNEYDEALNINFEEHISLRLHCEQHVKRKSLELFFHKVDIPMIRTYISQGIHFLTADFFGRLFSQQKMAILRYLLEQKIFQEANFIDSKFLQVYLAHLLNNPQNDFLLNLVCYQKHLLKGSWPEDEPHYYQRFFYNDKNFVHDMPIMIKDILARTQNSTDVLHRLRIYWSMQKMYLFEEDNIDLILEELKYTFFKTGNKDQQLAIKKEIGKLLNSSFSYVPLKQFIHNLVDQSSTFSDFMAFFSVSIILLSHLKSMNDLLDYDNVEHNYLYEYLHLNLEREQINPLFLMVFQLLNHEDHRRTDYENLKRSFDSYLRFKHTSKKLPSPSPISSLITKYKNLEFVYQRNPKAPSFTKFSITLDRSFFKSKVNQPRKYFEQKDMIQCLVKKDYESVLNHFLTTFTFTGQKVKVQTFYKKMKDADKNLSFKTRNEQAFYKMKLAKQIFFTHSLPQPLSFLKTNPIKDTYNALTLINDNFIDHDEHLQQFDIMNKYNYADILTRNLKIDNDRYAEIAQQEPTSETVLSQAISISYDVTESEEVTTTSKLTDQNESVEVEDEENSEVELDSDGNPIQQVEVDEEGNPIQNVEVDEEGNPIQEEVELDQNGNPVQVKLDEEGNKIQNVEVDENGNPIQEEVELDSDGNPIQVEHDSNGNTIEYDSDGNPISVEYDSHGNPIEYDSNGNTIEVEYDSEGNPINDSEQFDEDDELQQDGLQQATFNSGEYYQSTIQQQPPVYPFTPFDDKKMKEFNEKMLMRSIITGILFTPQEIKYIKQNLEVDGNHSQYKEEESAPYVSTQLEEYQKDTSEQQILNQEQESQNEQEQQTPNSSQFYFQSTSLTEKQSQTLTEGMQLSKQQGNEQESNLRESKSEQNKESQQIEGSQQQQIQQSSGQQIQQSQSQDENEQSHSQDEDGLLQSSNENEQNTTGTYFSSQQSSSQMVKMVYTSEILQLESTDLPPQYKVKQFRDKTSELNTDMKILLELQSCSQISTGSLNEAMTGTLPSQSITDAEESSKDQLVQGIINVYRQMKKMENKEEQKQILQALQEQVDEKFNKKLSLVLGEQFTEETTTITEDEGTTTITGEEVINIQASKEETANKTAVQSTSVEAKKAVTANETEEETTSISGEQTIKTREVTHGTDEITTSTLSSTEIQQLLESSSKDQTGEQQSLVTGQQSSVEVGQQSQSTGQQQTETTESMLINKSGSIHKDAKGNQYIFVEQTRSSSQQMTSETYLSSQNSHQRSSLYLSSEQSGSQQESSGQQQSSEYMQKTQEQQSQQELQLQQQQQQQKEQQQQQQEKVQKDQQQKQQHQQQQESSQQYESTQLSQRSLRQQQQLEQLQKAKPAFQYALPNDRRLKQLEERHHNLFGKVDYNYNEKSAYSYHLYEQGELTTEQGPEKQLEKKLERFHKKHMYHQVYYKPEQNSEQEESDDLYLQRRQQLNPLNHPMFMKRKQDYRKIRKYIEKFSDLKQGQKMEFRYNVTPQQLYSDDSQERAPIFKINYKDIKIAEFQDKALLKSFNQIPVFDEEKRVFTEKVKQIQHIWFGKREAPESQFVKAQRAQRGQKKEGVDEAKKEDVSEEAIAQIYNSMYKQGIKKQPESKINASKPAKSNTNKYNFSKTNKNRFQFCTVTPETVIHPPIHMSIVDFTKIDQYKTKPVDNDFLRTLQTELQIPKVGSGIVLAQYLFLQGKSATKTSIINPKKTLNIQFTSVVGTRTKNYEQYIKTNLFNYSLSQQLYTNLLEGQISKYNRSQFKKIIAHLINFHEELSDNIIRLICKICEREKIGYTFVQIVELIRVNNVKITSQALEIVTFLWQKFDIINEDMFPFLKLYTRKMQIPLRTQFYSEFCKSLIKTKKFNKLQIITSAILLELKPKQFKIDSSMNNLKADEVSQLQKQWKLREQQNYLRLYLELIDVIVTNLDSYVPPFLNEYFDEYLKLKNSLNEKELGLAFICYSLKRDKFLQLINKLDGEPEKGTSYMYDCLMKAILANFETLEDLTERSLDTTVLKNRLVLSLPQINKSLVIFKKCSSSNSFSKFLEHCLRFQQTLEQHSDIKREMFFILNNNVEQVSVGGIFNLLDFIFNEKRAKERIDYRAIKLSEEEKSRKLDLIRGTVTKVSSSEEGKVAVKQQKKVVKKKGKKNQEEEEEEVAVAVVQGEAKKQESLQVKEKHKKEQSTDGSDNKKDQKKKNKKEKKQEREKEASLLDQILAEKQSIGPGEGQAKGSNEAEILGMIKTQGKRHESTKRKCIKSMNRLFQGALELQRQQQAAKVLEAEKKVLATKQPVVEKKKGGAEGKKGKK